CTTGRDKAHPEVGLPGLFDEIYRGAWIIPCGMGGDDDVDPRVGSACTAAVNYGPDKHTKDAMMAWFLPWQCGWRWAQLVPRAVSGIKRPMDEIPTHVGTGEFE